MFYCKDTALDLHNRVHDLEISIYVLIFQVL